MRELLRRSWRYYPLLVALCLLSPTVAQDLTPEGELFGPYRVARVVDGDTVILALPQGEERTRLIGIDAPESVHPTLGEEPFDREASDFAKWLLEGAEVYIELDTLFRALRRGT